MKITYIYPADPSRWYSVEWRCFAPARAIRRTGRHSSFLLPYHEFISNTREAKEICAQSDVLILHRNLWGKALTKVQHWQARDKLVLADFEEAYQLLEEQDADYPFWMEGVLGEKGVVTEKMSPTPFVQFKWGLQLVHAATVPSKRLADDWQAYARVYFVPDYIDIERYVDILPQPHSEVILGWAGRSAQLKAFQASGLLESLGEIISMRPNVKVMICTESENAARTLGLPEDRVIYQPWSMESGWPRPLAYFDVGLAPLLSLYDQRSSWARVLEYMVMKIPWVASQGPAYHELRPYGWLVQNTPLAWKKILLDIIDHLDNFKEEAALTPYLFGISQSVDDNIDRIIEVYASIANRYASKANKRDILSAAQTAG